MKSIYAVMPILFAWQTGWAADLNHAEPRARWHISASHGFSRDKAAFDISQTGVITIPGGASYSSTSSGKTKFELDRSETAVEVTSPRWGVFQVNASFGSLNYEVSLPSGAYVNTFKDGSGFAAGIGLGWQALRQTLVTPHVEMRAGWKMTEAKLKQFVSGQSGVAQAVDNRLETDKFFLNCLVFKQYGRWAPQAGVEIFQIKAKLKNMLTNDSSAGDKLGYAFSAGVAREIYKSGFLTLNGFLGDELGYRLSLRQEF